MDAGATWRQEVRTSNSSWDEARDIIAKTRRVQRLALVVLLAALEIQSAALIVLLVALLAR